MHRGLKFTACSSAATCEWWDRGNQNENVQFREFLLMFFKVYVLWSLAKECFSIKMFLKKVDFYIGLHIRYIVIDIGYFPPF